MKGVIFVVVNCPPESTHVVGAFNTREEAEKAVESYKAQWKPLDDWCWRRDEAVHNAIARIFAEEYAKGGAEFGNPEIGSSPPDTITHYDKMRMLRSAITEAAIATIIHADLEAFIEKNGDKPMDDSLMAELEIIETPVGSLSLPNIQSPG